MTDEEKAYAAQAAAAMWPDESPEAQTRAFATLSLERQRIEIERVKHEVKKEG